MSIMADTFIKYHAVSIRLRIPRLGVRILCSILSLFFEV